MIKTLSLFSLLLVLAFAADNYIPEELYCTKTAPDWVANEETMYSYDPLDIGNNNCGGFPFVGYYLKRSQHDGKVIAYVPACWRNRPTDVGEGNCTKNNPLGGAYDILQFGVGAPTATDGTRYYTYWFNSNAGILSGYLSGSILQSLESPGGYALARIADSEVQKVSDNTAVATGATYWISISGNNYAWYKHATMANCLDLGYPILHIISSTGSTNNYNITYKCSKYTQTMIDFLKSPGTLTAYETKVTGTFVMPTIKYAYQEGAKYKNCDLDFSPLSLSCTTTTSLASGYIQLEFLAQIVTQSDYDLVYSSVSERFESMICNNDLPTCTGSVTVTKSTTTSSSWEFGMAISMETEVGLGFASATVGAEVSSTVGGGTEKTEEVSYAMEFDLSGTSILSVTLEKGKKRYQRESQVILIPHGTVLMGSNVVAINAFIPQGQGMYFSRIDTKSVEGYQFAS